MDWVGLEWRWEQVAKLIFLNTCNTCRTICPQTRYNIAIPSSSGMYNEAKSTINKWYINNINGKG